MLASSLLMAVGPSRSAHAADGYGRVLLAPGWPVFDSRMGTGAHQVTGPIAVPASLADVGIAADAAGVAWVSPCGTPHGSDPVAVFEAGEAASFTVVGGNQCVTTSTPVVMVIQQIGSVSDTPENSRLQYVPLAAPAVILDQDLPSANDHDVRQIALPNPPADGGGAVLRLDVEGPTSGYAAVVEDGTCYVGTVQASGRGRYAAMAYVEIPGGGAAALCLHTLNASHVKLTLLGYLRHDGPDPTRLPPTLGYVSQTLPPPGLVAITPTRVLDTREPIGVPTKAKLVGGSWIRLDLTSYVDENSTAAVLNVAVVDPDADGFITAYPCDAPSRPVTANLNYVKGETRPNLVTVKLAADHTVCLFSYATTDLVADLSGTYERIGGAGIVPLTPYRLLDTRDGTGVAAAGELPAGQVLTLQVAGRGGAPATGITAVTLNVAVVGARGPGFITAYPCDRPRPLAANLNFVAGQTVPNAVTVAVSATGTLCLFTYATTHLVADLSAWFGAANVDGFHELVPYRLLDTREPIGTTSKAPLPAGQVLTLQVAGRGGVPASGASAVTMNVTVTDPASDGFLTVFPCDQDRPLAANLNFDRGQTVSNLVTAKLSATGTVCIYTLKTTDLVADLAGNFTATPEQVEVLELIGG